MRALKLGRWQRLLLSLIVLCTLVSAHRLRAQDSPLPAPEANGAVVTLDEYHALLTELSAELAGTDPASAIPPALLERMAAVQQLTLPSGEEVQLANLLQDVTSVRVARARITLALEQLELAVRDRLDERTAALSRVLARPEFHENVSLLDRISRWIDELLEWLLPEPLQETNPAIEDAGDRVFTAVQWALTIGGGVLIALMLGYWMQRLLRNFVGDAELRRRRAAGDAIPLTASEARAQAGAQAQAGSFRSAVRSLYLSALLALEENEVISADRTLTNRELLARTDNTPAGEQIKPVMQPVVQRFDDVWYGMTEPDATTYATYEQDIARLNQTISSAKAPQTAPAATSADAPASPHTRSGDDT